MATPTNSMDCHSGSYGATSGMISLGSLIPSEEASVLIDEAEPLPERSLPTVFANVVYKGLCMFHLRAKSKTHVKQTVLQISENDTQEYYVPLLDPAFIKLIKANQSAYKFMEIEMIQIDITPFTRRGLNNSCVCCVLDCRHSSFIDNLCGAVQTGLHDGPIEFKSYPNCSLSIHDPDLDKVLKCLIKTSGFNMLPGSCHLSVMARIMYRFSNTLHPAVKHDRTRGSSLVIRTDPHNHKIESETIEWRNITVPSEWTTSTGFLSEPPRVQPLSRAITKDHGKVLLSFLPAPVGKKEEKDFLAEIDHHIQGSSLVCISCP